MKKLKFATLSLITSTVLLSSCSSTSCFNPCNWRPGWKKPKQVCSNYQDYSNYNSYENGSEGEYESGYVNNAEPAVCADEQVPQGYEGAPPRQEGWFEVNPNEANRSDRSGEFNRYDRASEMNQYDRVELNRYDRSGEVNRYDRTGDVNRYDRSVEVNQYERSGEVNRFDRSGEVNRFDRSSDINRSDRSGEVNRSDRTGDVNRYDRSGEVNRSDRTGDVNRYDRSNEINRSDRATEVNRYEGSTEVKRYDTTGDNKQKSFSPYPNTSIEDVPPQQYKQDHIDSKDVPYYDDKYRSNIGRERSGQPTMQQNTPKNQETQETPSIQKKDLDKIRSAHQRVLDRYKQYKTQDDPVTAEDTEYFDQIIKRVQTKQKKN